MTMSQTHSMENGRPTISPAEMRNLSPRQIVEELDRYVIGQRDAKRMVAIALRNRWRRQQLSPDLRDEQWLVAEPSVPHRDPK